MCVIAVVDKTRITEEMVEKMYSANASGGGVAWREEGEGGAQKVRWEKGLTEEQMQEYCKTLPLPFVAHFRIPTCGGAIPDLCHPFPIDRKASTDTSGETYGYVLFHNGHWTDWKKTSMEAAIKTNGLPPGKWSDTRGMAFVAGIYGLGILEFIDEMSIAFGPYDTELTGNRWVRVNDVIVSNRGWEYHTTNAYRRTGAKLELGPAQDEMCEAGAYQRPIDSRLPTIYHPKRDIDKQNEEKAGGTSQPIPFRNAEDNVGNRGNISEQVQAGVQKAGEVAKGSKAGPAEDEDDSPLNPMNQKKWACSLNPKRFLGTVRNLAGEENDEAATGRKITPIKHNGIERAIII